MGLGISSLSDKTYHYGYSGIHMVRYMGYRAVGGVADYGGWHEMQRSGEDAGKYGEALHRFPNLYWHSDCDGEYTLDGKVEPFDNVTNGLSTGNSKELLAELQYIKDTLANSDDKQVGERDWFVFTMLYDVVKDVVENHDGVLEFC